jgi:ABC-2 type transport system permease protein
MSRRTTAATARRVLEQLRRDRRTLALLLLVPCLLMALLRWVFDANPHVFDAVGAALLGIFPFVTMFLVTSVATLRERTSGTLERLLTMPMGRADLLAGYAIAFGLVSFAQVALASAVTVGPLGLHVAGSAGLVWLVAVLDAMLGVALGLLVSAFATTEFQAVQFMPAVVVPQLLLCGLLAPRDGMAGPLRVLSDLMPLSYAVDAMQRVTVSTVIDGGLVVDVAIIGSCAIVAVIGGAATLRRRTP